MKNSIGHLRDVVCSLLWEAIKDSGTPTILLLAAVKDIAPIKGGLPQQRAQAVVVPRQEGSITVFFLL